MEAALPDFVAALREKGLQYTRVLPNGDDPGSAIGRGWQSTYGTDDKAVAEAKCRALGGTCEWLPGDELKARSSRHSFILDGEGRFGRGGRGERDRQGKSARLLL